MIGRMARLHQPEILKDKVERHKYVPPAEEMSFDTVKLISVKPRFSREFLGVHSLSHYKRMSGGKSLVPKVGTLMDLLIIQEEDLGETI